MSSPHPTPPVQRAGHAPFLSELAVLGVFRLWVKPKGMPDSFSALLTSPRLSAFTVAGADVQTLRERLINALETHSVTWPPACPPLEPARYWGSGQAWGRVARITGLEARGGGDSREEDPGWFFLVPLERPSPRAGGLPGSPDFLGLTDRCKDLTLQVGRERGRRSPGHACCRFSLLSPGTFGDAAEFHMV